MTTPQTRGLRVLRVPGMRDFTMAFYLDRSADILWWVALGWIASQLSWAGVLLGVLAVLGAVGMFPGGWLVDRWSAREVLAVTALLRMTAFAVWAMVVTAGHGGLVPSTVIAAVALSVLDGAHFPAADAVAVELLPDSAQESGVAIERLAGRLAQLTAGLLAGALLAPSSIRWVGVVCAVLSAVVAIIALRLRGLPSAPRRTADGDAEREETTGGAAQLLAGLRFVAGDRLLRRTIPVQGSANALTGGITLVCFPLLVRQLGWPDASYGLLFGCMSAGLAVGTLAVILYPDRPDVGRPGWAMLLMAMGGAGYAVLGLIGEVGHAYLMAFVIGVVQGPTGALLTGLTRARAHGQQMQGAVVAVNSFALMGCEPLGYVVVGLVAGWTSAASALAIVGAGLLLLGLWGASARQIWTVRNS